MLLETLLLCATAARMHHATILKYPNSGYRFGDSLVNHWEKLVHRIHVGLRGPEPI